MIEQAREIWRKYATNLKRLLERELIFGLKLSQIMLVLWVVQEVMQWVVVPLAALVLLS